MILNEAVTLLGYKVDERGLQKYQRQIENQRKEALKLLATHQKAEAAKVKAAENTARANERLDQRLQRNAERQLAQEIRNASRITAAKEREAAKQLRAQELAYNRQVAANARALAAMDRANERHLNTQIRQAQRASAAQARAAVAAAKATERERAKSSAFLRGGMGGMGLGMMGLGAGALSVGGAVAGAKSVYDTGVERESYMAGLRNLPGMNAGSALAQFKALEKFNLQTPYTLDEIIQGYIRLKNVGLDASETAMRAYGGIAASIPGKKINDFVEAVADGVMGQGRRLKEFGIDLSMAGDKAVISFRNQTYTVGRSSKEIEKALQGLAFKHFGKTMEEMAKTTGGQMSNLQDQFENLKWQIWQGGMKDAVGKLIKGAADLLKKVTPLAREFAIISRLNLKRTLSATAEGLKLVAGAIGVLMLKTVGDAYITMIANIGKMSTALKTLGWSAFYAQSGLSAIVKGGAIVTLALILADFVYYLNTGDSNLVQFTERWPALSRAIKDGYYWNKVFIEAVTIGFSKIWIKINDVYQKTKLWFDHIKNEIANPLVLKFLAAMAGGNPIVGGVVNLLGGGAPSTGPNAGSSSAPMGNLANSAILGPGLVKNQSLAKQFTDIGPTIIKTRALCLQAVWDIQNAAMKGTSKLAVTHAYLGADKLAQDKRFKEVQFTPEMYQKMMAGDPQLKALMHGATVIYNRQSGFSTESGHGEIWDTYKNKSYYGKGATGLKRSAQMINNARFFVPVQQQQMPAPNQGGSFQTSSASVMLNQNFYGQTDPRKAGSAAQTGVQSGLNRVQIGLPTYTNGIA